VPSTAPPPDSCAVTDVSFPLATLTDIGAAGSTSEEFAAGLITRTAGEASAGDEGLCDVAPGEVADEEGEDPCATGATAAVLEEFPPPPHAAVSPTTAIATASLCSPRIIASRVRSYNWVVAMAPQPAGEPLGFP
jgi:hypothetical protein